MTVFIVELSAPLLPYKKGRESSKRTEIDNMKLLLIILVLSLSVAHISPACHRIVRPVCAVDRLGRVFHFTNICNMRVAMSVYRQFYYVVDIRMCYGRPFLL